MARYLNHGRIIIDITRQADGTVKRVVSATNPDIIETEGTAFEKAPRNYNFDLSGIQQEVGPNVTVGQLITGYVNAIKAQANTDD